MAHFIGDLQETADNGEPTYQNTEELRHAFASSFHVENPHVSPTERHVQSSPGQLRGQLMYDSEFHTSGIESSDVDNPDVDPLSPCEVCPSTCQIGEIIPILISLDQDNGLKLTEKNCKVKFIGTKSKREEIQGGRRGGNDYVIKLDTPLWNTVEKVLVVVRTQRGSRCTVLGRGDFTFLPKPKDPSMSFQLNMVPDESSKRFLAAMQRGAEFNALAGPGGSSSGQPGVSGTPATNTASFYLAYGESSIIKLVERMIVYAVNNGLPTGVSLLHIIGNLPKMGSILASCSFSNGSLDGLIEYVKKKTSPNTLISKEIEELVRMARDPVSLSANCYDSEQEEDAGYVDLPHDSVSQAVLHTSPEEIVPNETGLQLPRQLNMSSETGKDILLRHKRGEITANRAIEESRDYVYSKTSRQQLKGNRTRRGQDKSDSTSISSAEEGKGTKMRRPRKPPKNPEEQQIIRARLASSGSKTSEWSTTSQTNSTNIVFQSSNSNVSMDNSVSTNRGGQQIPAVTVSSPDERLALIPLSQPQPVNVRRSSSEDPPRQLESSTTSTDSGIAMDPPSPPVKQKPGRGLLRRSSHATS